ncbi:MAG: hypothetical protein N3G21_04905 [Candidatus Hydrogenedentes bacterium]|nr:hypothetical protein [Candidatus Hydrogenedentota bacterium]
MSVLGERLNGSVVVKEYTSIIKSSLFRELLILFALGIATVLFSIYNYNLQPWTLDDAFITFRYAENFVEGKGIVYNEGEYVEGYTCFLWLIILAGVKELGFDIVTASKLLGTLFTFFSLLLLSRIHKIVKCTSWFISLASTLILGSFGCFTAWAMSGMETSMTGFWVLATFLLYAALTSRGSTSWFGYFLIGVLIALATMSRIDAGIILPPIFLCVLYESWKIKKWSLPIALIVGFGILYCPYFIWRWYYYGWILPNTFYVKVGSSWDQIERGLDYTKYFLLSSSILLIPVVFSQMLSGKALGNDRLFVISSGGAVFLQFLYVIIVGGDCMPAYRFFAPIAPLIAILASYGLSIESFSKWKSYIALVIIVCFNFWQCYNDKSLFDRIISDTVAEVGRESGEWLRKNAPQNSLLATNTAGSVAYYSRLRVIDMLGLNDEHIAHRHIPNLGKGFAGHEKGDGKYVLSRKPDYIMFGSASGNKSPRFLSDREIAIEKEFAENYVYRTYPLPSGKVLHIYERKKNNR